MAAAPVTQQAPVVVVRSAEADRTVEEAHSVAEAHVEAVRSLTVEARTAVAHTEVMVAWEVAAKLKAPSHAPQHSSYAALRS